MMDIHDRVGQRLNSNRSDVMSAFLMRMSDFFCPSDRELALRGQIKTGWSTVAARKKSRPSQVKLPPQDVKHIAEVVAQAEALQMAEEIRIGVQMLKLQRLRNSCRGNGTSSCLVCGYDFTHHRSRSPISLHFCHECGQAVCSRCKAEYKYSTGETVVLCRLCSDQRELWKKSGAWLSNKLPVINVSEEELEKAQQQQQLQKVVPLRTDFMVPPSQLEDDDETEDDISTISGTSANYGGFPYLAGSAPSSRSPSPDLSFMSEANAAAAAWKGDRQSELHPQSFGHQLSNKQAAAMRKSGSYDLIAIRRQRTTTVPVHERTVGIVRKQAMSGEKKKDMDELRRKVVEKKKARSLVRECQQRTPSPILSVDPLRMKRSRSNDLPVMTSRLSPSAGSSPHPHIKVVKATPPNSPDMLRGETRSASPLTASTMAPESTAKPPEPDSTTTPSPATVHSGAYDRPSSSQQDSTTVTAVEKKCKPVPSPRRKLLDSDSPSATQQDQQASTHVPGEFNRVVIGSVEGIKYGTLEREKKPTAAPRKRTGSLDKERSRRHGSGTLEKKHRATRTPEPQASGSVPPLNKKPLGSSTSLTGSPSYSSVLPAEVPSKLEREVTPPKQSSVDVSASKGDPPNPKLKEIGKTVSVASDSSVESGRDSVTRNDSGGSGDHRWQRKGARRGGVRHKHQPEVDDDDFSPRGRTRSGALSGGGSAPRRGHHTTMVEDEQQSSRSRTRSGAMAGSDAAAIRRGRRVSPRPAHHAVSRQHSGSSVPDDNNSPFHANSADAKVSSRRAARTGGDLASDGEHD